MTVLGCQQHGVKLQIANFFTRLLKFFQEKVRRKKLFLFAAFLGSRSRPKSRGEALMMRSGITLNSTPETRF